MKLSDPRWKRARAWAVTERIRNCSTCAVPSGVRLGVVDGRARSAGLMRCASVASCPRCREAILAERAHTIETLGLRAFVGGAFCYHVTLTYRHLRRERPFWARPFIGPRSRQAFTVDDEGRRIRRHVASTDFVDEDTFDADLEAEQGLERWLTWRLTEELSALRSGYRSMTKHRRFTDFASYVGWNAVTSLEVTHGRHGWHPHYHLFVITEREVTGEAWSALSTMWSEAFEVERDDGSVDRSRCGEHGHNLNVRQLRNADDIVAAAKYVSKADLSPEQAAAHDAEQLADAKRTAMRELASAAAEVSANAKESRHGMTPWAMLVDESTNWRPHYRAYARAMQGVKVVNFPKAFMRASGIADVRDEEAAIARDALNKAEVATITRHTYSAIVRARAVHLVDALLDALAAGECPRRHVAEHWPSCWQNGVTYRATSPPLTTRDDEWEDTLALLWKFPDVA